MLLWLLSLAQAGRLVEVQYQEGRISDLSFSQDGLHFQAEVRDVCHFWVHNLWYFERLEEWERPCSDWRPMEAIDPQRRLMALPRELSRPIRGPVVAGSHAVAADLTLPHGLRGSVWGAAFENGEWLIASEALGAALVLADLVGEAVERLNLRVHADAYVGEQAVLVKWRANNRPELIDDTTLRVEEPTLERVGASWRCQGLTTLHPDDFMALTGELSDQVAYLAARRETCPGAVEKQAPAICTLAQEAVAAARSPEELERAHGVVELIVDHCDIAYTAVLQERIAALYAEAFERGRLDQADDLVRTYGEVMGERWTSEARTQVDQMIRDTIPNRFDWAVQNRAKAQALELIERYGPVLGEGWTSQAQRRVERL